MTDVPRRDDGGAESARDADHGPLGPEDRGDGVGAADPVLDRQDDGPGAGERVRGLGRGAHVHRLRGDDDQVDLADLRRACRRSDPHRSISGRSLDAQPVTADRRDVRLPGVDGPDVVARRTEQACVDRAHRARADDRDSQWWASRTGS